jgi:hypothetical protein
MGRGRSGSCDGGGGVACSRRSTKECSGLGSVVKLVVLANAVVYTKLGRAFEWKKI